MLGFVLKLMVSTETTKAGGDEAMAPQISRTTPSAFKHKVHPAAHAFLSPASANSLSYFDSSSKAATIQNQQTCHEMIINEMLEGDTVTSTPDLEKFVSEILEGVALSPDLEMSDMFQKTNNNSSPDKGNNSCPELMDVSTKELDSLLGNGRHHAGGSSSQMDLLLDIPT